MSDGSDGGWHAIYPKRVPIKAEVELWGGPCDGERLVVYDVDSPLVRESTGGGKIVFRRRLIDPDKPEPMPLRFDYQPPVPTDTEAYQ